MVMWDQRGEVGPAVGVSAEQYVDSIGSGLWRGAAVQSGRWVQGCSAPAPAPSDSVDQAVETYGLQKITLLREISLKTGIQVGPPFPPGPQSKGKGAFSGG